MNTIKLSPKQAFYLWLRTENNAPRGIKFKLFGCFGGVESKVYRQWSKEQNKLLKTLISLDKK